MDNRFLCRDSRDGRSLVEGEGAGDGDSCIQGWLSASVGVIRSRGSHCKHPLRNDTNWIDVQRSEEVSSFVLLFFFLMFFSEK